MAPASRVDSEGPVWAAQAALVVAALAFGSTFIVVKDALAHARPIPFLGVRFTLGAAVLLAVDAFRPGPRALRRRWAGELRAGSLAGLALCGGYIFQTVGLQYTSTSVSAFVTYLLVVLVPVLAAIRYRRWPAPSTVIGAVLATGGLALLTGKGLALGRGEGLTFGCACCFAVHILVLAEGAPRLDALRLNAVQLAVVGGTCGVIGLGAGGYHLTGAAWVAAAYTALVASALALGLQVWGQRRVGPSRASLLLMIEPVSAAMIGAASGEHLGVAGVAGAGLILAGIAVAEIAPLIGARTDEPVGLGG